MSSCYLTPIARSQFKALPHYGRISDVNSFTDNLKEKKIDLADVKALGFKITGSDRAVSISDGKKVETLKIKSDNDLKVIKDILRTIASNATGAINLIFNIAGFPTIHVEQPHLKALLDTKGIKGQPGQFYLANYNSGTILDVNDMLSQASFVNTDMRFVPEVINDTVITAYSAATILSQGEAFSDDRQTRSKNKLQDVDGMILGTGMNIGQCRGWDRQKLSFDTTNNLEFGQLNIAKNSNSDIYDKFIDDSIYEPLYNSVYYKSGKTAVALEKLFSGGDNGIRAVLELIHHRIKSADNKEKALDDEVKAFLKAIGLAARLDLIPVAKESILFRSLDQLPTDREITDMAAIKDDVIFKNLLADKYTRLAGIYKYSYPRNKATKNDPSYYFAASGSVVVDDLSRVTTARRAFCDGLDIGQGQLFLHQLGAVDGMDSMVRARAALAKASA